MDTLANVSDDFYIAGTPEYTFTYSAVKNSSVAGVNGQINGGCGRTSINQFQFLNIANEKDSKFDVYEGKELFVGLSGTVHESASPESWIPSANYNLSVNRIGTTPLGPDVISYSHNNNIVLNQANLEMDLNLSSLAAVKLTVGKDAPVFAAENYKARGYGGAGANAVFPNWGAVLDVDLLGLDWKFAGQFITDDYNAPNTALGLQQTTVLNDQVAYQVQAGYEMKGSEESYMPESMALRVHSSLLYSSPAKFVAGGQVNSLTPVLVTGTTVVGALAGMTVAQATATANTSANGGLTPTGTTIQPFNPLQTVTGQAQWGYDVGGKLSVGSVDLLGGFAMTANLGSRILNQGSALQNKKNQMWFAKIQHEKCATDECEDVDAEIAPADSTWYNPLNWSMPGLDSIPFNFAVDYGSTTNSDATVSNTNVNNLNTSVGAEISMPYEKFEGLFKFRQWNSNTFNSALKASVQEYGLGGRCHF